MKNRYIDLIEQTFDWPQQQFSTSTTGELHWHNLDLYKIAQTYGTPLRISYLPKISYQIKQAEIWFNEAMDKAQYQQKYHYCYCTKSSHFSFILDEVLKNDTHLETSSAYDMEIIHKLLKSKKLNSNHFIICNGYKTDRYIEKIAHLRNQGYSNIIPVLDNQSELERLLPHLEEETQLGIRIATEEEPNFNFYTSRLGIRYNAIIPFYLEKIKDNPLVKLKMLHFFINNGIKDNAYYWNELMKAVEVYCELKKVCPSLDSLNIGGGFPYPKSLDFSYDYQYMIEEIISQIKSVCQRHGIIEPHIFTEFGSYTVAQSGMLLYQILDQKRQNDREKWNMIDSSFLTTVPDTWAINQRFIILPIHRWNDTYERVNLGGLTCDSNDFYNANAHFNDIFLPYFCAKKPLYIGMFHTGAYQEAVGGYGGIQHCLIPAPKHIIIRKEKEKTCIEVFREQQTPESMLSILGY